MGKSAISTVPFSIAWLNTPKKHGPNGMWKFPTKIDGFGPRGCLIWTGERIIYHIWFPQKINGKLDSSDVFHLLQNTTRSCRAGSDLMEELELNWLAIYILYILTMLYGVLYTYIYKYHPFPHPQIPWDTAHHPIETQGFSSGSRHFRDLWRGPLTLTSEYVMLQGLDFALWEIHPLVNSNVFFLGVPS